MTKTQSRKANVKEKLGLRKTLETDFDEKGRVCTKCGEYKEWSEFYACRKTTTGKQSSCKVCKLSHRKSVGRKYHKEYFSAKKHKKNLKKTDPHLLRARNLRSSLMTRARKLDLDRTEIPTAETIKVWLLGLEPLRCYYTGVEVELFKCHIDHKIPLRRGGSNSLDNLCVTDSKVNSAKGAMTEVEFKQLLELVSSWEDKGLYLMSRLRMGHFGKLK